MCIYDRLPYKDLYTALSMLTHRLNVSLESLSRDPRNVSSRTQNSRQARPTRPSFALQDRFAQNRRPKKHRGKRSYKIDDLALLSMMLHNHAVCTDNVMHRKCNRYAYNVDVKRKKNDRFRHKLQNITSLEKKHVGVKHRSISITHIKKYKAKSCRVRR
ncbi:PREDICTED: uncharacterized protein LOC105448148 isoform X2 [Wasmannia auropunctata]|uniref:uncharacterized protein LOC105448148 isoform X2 n=1 Tax=Wasmannia auropunctata TaxID=64793 RepID=UPI0005EDE780|nr:PREDICTED: uncharacterized protein LOC105448148 isoform X2 [Wasmannia auropunctata]XP_011684857.1 PREDICTED: uncharacterized protein LOC105448148 isoform X2 [Wasmannia auropunctata]XP_011684858.1 PREDICTED: uncharacterized protein LOC105448148 isoform X2 [Wasmannia auropunctata]XP_011684859.1 PREDICTED: uncharacterized protein LOC105448148 isoform X2 [Wasmannia auropunctata]XP_011684860.1 PREDICTED: uncharacterized protein LOC105448148 isoform X2 [Wasmannia auropunctata]